MITSASKLRRRKSTAAHEPQEGTFRHQVPRLEQNDKNCMSVAEIEATLNILMMAGSETTATALNGITHFVMRSLNISQRLGSEIRTASGCEDGTTLAATRELLYLNAAIPEGLRICNPALKALPRIDPNGCNIVCWY